MANQNQKIEKTENGGEQPVQQAPVQNPNPETQQVATPVEQKQTVGGWLKKHWKGALGAVLGTAAVGGSALVAYKKGKAAGIASVPYPQQETEDYSLNPNE